MAGPHSLHVCFVHYHHMCACSMWRSIETIGYPGTGFTGVWGRQCGCWELNVGLLESSRCFYPLSHFSSPPSVSFKITWSIWLYVHVHGCWTYFLSVSRLAGFPSLKKMDPLSSSRLPVVPHLEMGLHKPLPHPPWVFGGFHLVHVHVLPVTLTVILHTPFLVVPSALGWGSSIDVPCRRQSICTPTGWRSP